MKEYKNDAISHRKIIFTANNMILNIKKEPLI